MTDPHAPPRPRTDLMPAALGFTAGSPIAIAAAWYLSTHVFEQPMPSHVEVALGAAVGSAVALVVSIIKRRFEV
jgi:hypothetical protein